MTSVNVLAVYQFAGEAERLVEELQRGGYGVQSRRVATRDEMDRAILSDFELPGFTALEALALVKERDLDTPFLIVSESIGEETAIRVLKAGVHNCIFRGELARLAATLERELREAASRQERRRAQKALRESESRFRSLAETASDAILIVDEDGLILFANRAAERTFGAPAPSLIGEPLTTVLLAGSARSPTSRMASVRGWRRSPPKSVTGGSSSATWRACTGRLRVAASSTATTPSRGSSGSGRGKKYSSSPTGTFISPRKTGPNRCSA